MKRETRITLIWFTAVPGLLGLFVDNMAGRVGALVLLAIAAICAFVGRDS